MSQIQTRLDSARYQIEEQDVFTRIMRGEFWDEEEVRYDRPLNYANAAAYIGIAAAGSSVMDPVWCVVKRSYDANGKVYRDQFRSKVSWTERTNNWI